MTDGLFSLLPLCSPPITIEPKSTLLDLNASLSLSLSAANRPQHGSWSALSSVDL